MLTPRGHVLAGLAALGALGLTGVPAAAASPVAVTSLAPPRSEVVAVTPSLEPMSGWHGMGSMPGMDGGHSMPEMDVTAPAATAAQPSTGPAEHPADMPGMDMSTPMPSSTTDVQGTSGEHSADMPGMDMSGGSEHGDSGQTHGGTTPAAPRPRAAVLAGFGLVNASAMGAAAFLRRRKRRERLEQLRRRAATRATRATSPTAPTAIEDTTV